MKYFRYIRSFHSSVQLVLPQCGTFTFPLCTLQNPIAAVSVGRLLVRWAGSGGRRNEGI